MNLFRSCGWCGRQLDATSRRDARWCSKVCRQAAHRASHVRRAAIAPGAPRLRLAYADPPYPGKAELYRDHPDFAGEVDHAELVSRLASYDGWLLHTSAAALPSVLALASRLERRRVRVAAWVRGSRPHPHAAILNAWEPVIYVRARREGVQLEDAMIGPEPRRRTTLPTAVVGAKPPVVAAWGFDLIGAQPQDDLEDLYPGSGIVARTWRLWCGLEAAPAGGLLDDQLEDLARGRVP